MAWNTVDRWLEKAAASCHRFNDQKIEKDQIWINIDRKNPLHKYYNRQYSQDADTLGKLSAPCGLTRPANKFRA
jgi:hypothetical protein